MDLGWKSRSLAVEFAAIDFWFAQFVALRQYVCHV
jgi:hypothetical protein